MNLRLLLTVAILAIIFSGCGKETAIEPAPTPAPASFTTYTIQTGAHYCDQSTLKPITVTNGIAFNVKFNSSAIYQTKDPANQEDINKLWGFSEGEDHQLNSARIGWAFCRDSLRLYGYTYAAGKRSSREITAIETGRAIRCAINLTADGYSITILDKTIKLPRERTSLTTTGYQLYPYFGGDETAPHPISIDIQPL